MPVELIRVSFLVEEHCRFPLLFFFLECYCGFLLCVTYCALGLVDASVSLPLQTIHGVLAARILG